MNDKTIFRTIVILSLLLVVAGFFASYDTSFPPELTSYVEKMEQQPISSKTDAILAIISIVLGMLLLYSYFAMIFFKNHARYIFLVTIIAAVPINLLGPVIVETNLQNTIIGLQILLDGMIIAMAFFSSCKMYF